MHRPDFLRLALATSGVSFLAKDFIQPPLARVFSLRIQAVRPRFSRRWRIRRSGLLLLALGWPGDGRGELVLIASRRRRGLCPQPLLKLLLGRVGKQLAGCSLASFNPTRHSVRETLLSLTRLAENLPIGSRSGPLQRPQVGYQPGFG